MKLFGFILALFLFCQALGATELQLPTEEDIQQEMNRNVAQRQTLFDPAAREQAFAVFPKIKMPQMPGMGGVDIEALAKRYEPQNDIRLAKDELLVFVSLAMPKASLKSLLKQADQLGATVLLRGFQDQSIAKTTLAIHRLGAPSGRVQIHPEAFKSYKVHQVPTLVLTQDLATNTLDAEGCALPERFIAISGDVSLDYALEQIAKRAPEFASQAQAYLRQLRTP